MNKILRNFIFFVIKPYVKALHWSTVTKLSTKTNIQMDYNTIKYINIETRDK